MIEKTWRLAILASLLAGAARAALPAPSPCETDSGFRALDFWVGKWNVYDSGTGERAGTSVLKRILRGCAVSVDWHDADGGGEIEELFFYEKARKTWHQVWISDTGPVKERHSIDGLPDGSVRFLGEVLRLDGTSYLDRSTVTPLASGGVHQRIEISRDGGKMWQTTFDGEYRRARRRFHGFTPIEP